MIDYFDREGNPIDLVQCAELLKDFSYKLLARTTITSTVDTRETYDVSTVWLGLDYNFGHGPPLIFETMIFGDGSLDCFRYSTEQGARVGHDEAVTVVASTMDDPVIMDVTDDVLAMLTDVANGDPDA